MVGPTSYNHVIVIIIVTRIGSLPGKFRPEHRAETNIMNISSAESITDSPPVVSSQYTMWQTFTECAQLVKHLPVAVKDNYS